MNMTEVTRKKGPDEGSFFDDLLDVEGILGLFTPEGYPTVFKSFYRF